MIPKPCGNFWGRAEALVTSGAINDKNPQNFWADLSLERLEHKHCSGAEEQGKKTSSARALDALPSAQFGVLVHGDQSSIIVNNSFKNNNFIVLILAFRIL